MVKANHLWALKIKIENSPQDDLETGKLLKKYIEKGSTWAYEVKILPLKTERGFGGQARDAALWS